MQFYGCKNEWYSVLIMTVDSFSRPLNSANPLGFFKASWRSDRLAFKVKNEACYIAHQIPSQNYILCKNTYNKKFCIAYINCLSNEKKL